MQGSTYTDAKKPNDWLAVFYILALAALLLIFLDEFISLTKTHPYKMGFLKVALLATFGECLKMRLTAGTYKISKPIARFIIWGLFGIWFTAAFPFVNYGVEGLITAGLWPDCSGFWLAVSRSLWINTVGGYAFTMMVTHEYFNEAIDHKRVISLSVFAKSMGNQMAALAWFRFIPLTIFFFWIPAHTITYMLPSYYRILFAAALSVVLGFIITLAKQKK